GAAGAERLRDAVTHGGEYVRAIEHLAVRVGGERAHVEAVTRGEGSTPAAAVEHHAVGVRLLLADARDAVHVGAVLRAARSAGVVVDLVLPLVLAGGRRREIDGGRLEVV